MDKRFWGIIAVIALIFVGIIWANSKSAQAPEAGKTGQVTNHVKGDNAKKVTLVEYGDFQCPVCGLYEPVVKQVVEKYQTQISFQFSNFPLQQIHQNAFAAARAAEAAGAQNKYWEMHDLLYANQNVWSTASDPLSIFTEYAKSLGMKADQFKTDFSSSKVNRSINADIQAGTKLGITGTPTFYINGKLIELKTLVADNNQPTLEKFSQVIDQAIAKQK